MSSRNSRILHRPIINISKNHLTDYPRPLNIKYLWNFGSTIGIFFVVQAFIGFFLPMHFNIPIMDMNRFTIYSNFKRFISGACLRAIQYASTLCVPLILYFIVKWFAIKWTFYCISNFEWSWMMKHFGATIKFYLNLCYCSGEELSLPGLSETSLSEQDNELFRSRSLIVNSTPAIDSSGNYRRMIPTVRNTMGNLRPGPEMELSFMESRSAVILTDPGPGYNFNSVAPFSPYFDTPIGPIFSIEYNYSLLKIFSLRYPSYIEDFFIGNVSSSSSCSGDTDELFNESLALIRAQQIDQNLNQYLSQNLSINSDSVNVPMGARVSVTPSEDISSSSSALVDDSSSSAPSDSNESGFIIEKGVPIHKNFYIWVSKILGVETDVSDPNLDSEEAARRDRIRVIALSDTPLREILEDINDGFIIRGPRPRPPSVGLD